MFEIHTDEVRHDKYIWLDGSDSIKWWRYDISDVKSELSSMSGMEEIIAALSVIEEEMAAEMRILEDTGNAIAAVTNKYDETEETVIEEISNLQYRAFAGPAQVGYLNIDGSDKYGQVDRAVMSELLQLIS